MRRRQTHAVGGEELTERQSLLAHAHELHEAEEEERAFSKFDAARKAAAEAFDAHNPSHTALLLELWSGSFPDSPFERTSERWKQLGFQGVDPVTDLRATGVEGLAHLQRFVNVGGLPPGVPRDFPLAIASINVTGALNRLLHLNTTVVIPGAPPAADERVLAAFMQCLSAQPNTLQAMHDALLLHLVQRWRAHKEASPAATIMEFPLVLAATFSHLGSTLSAAPRPWHLPSLAAALRAIPIETPALAFAFGIVCWVWTHICSCGSGPPAAARRGCAPEPAASRWGASWGSPQPSVKIS